MSPITSYGNRGKQLERVIRKLFLHYTAAGIPCHQNYPRTVQGKPVEKHGFDFELLHAGIFYAFDAKMCERDSWSVTDNAKPHQIQALRDVTAQGGMGFFLVWFVHSKQLVRFKVPLEYPTLKALKPMHGEILAGVDFLGVVKK